MTREFAVEEVEPLSAEALDLELTPFAAHGVVLRRSRVSSLRVICIGSEIVSTRAARLTLGPNRSYTYFCTPTSEPITGPELIPMRVPSLVLYAQTLSAARGPDLGNDAIPTALGHWPWHRRSLGS